MAALTSEESAPATLMCKMRSTFRQQNDWHCGQESVLTRGHQRGEGERDSNA